MTRNGWTVLRWWSGMILVFCGVARAEPVDGAAPKAGRGRASLDAQLTEAPRRPAAGASIAEWQWDFQRFVNVGSPEPVGLQESVRVGFANRGDSYVRVTYRVKSPAGFPAGSFRGRKELSYTIERIYSRVVIRGKRFLARGEGPFRLVESDPGGHSLADFSTLGGIARGKNMVAVVDEAFGGENLFALDGNHLSFVNQHLAGSNARVFPAQIVMVPVGD